MATTSHYSLRLVCAGVALVAYASIMAESTEEWQTDSLSCGRRTRAVSQRIIGGHPAQESAWPWQVAMLIDGDFSCGGSLVDPWWVITAAHCITECNATAAGNYTFRMGSNSLGNDSEFTQIRSATRILAHSQYHSSDVLLNDIALFRMAAPFDITEDATGTYRVNTVCLPTKEMEDRFVVGQDVTVTGWGALYNNRTYPDKLYEAVIPIYDQDVCNTTYEGGLRESMICAGLEEGGVDTCFGDSGGPMVAFADETSDQYYLVGITSFGKEACATPHVPGVYTRVTEFENWIRNYVFGNATTGSDVVPCLHHNGYDKPDNTDNQKLYALAIIPVVAIAVFVVVVMQCNKKPEITDANKPKDRWQRENIGYEIET